MRGLSCGALLNLFPDSILCLSPFRTALLFLGTNLSPLIPSDLSPKPEVLLLLLLLVLLLLVLVLVLLLLLLL